MIEELKRYGLSDNEAGTYLICLQLNDVPVIQIIERSPLTPNNVLEVLHKLDSLGFITVRETGHGLYIKPNDPARLEEWLERQKVVLKQILPTLQDSPKSTIEQPSVETLHGNAEIIKALKSILKQSEELIVIGSLRSLCTIIEYSWDEFRQDQATHQTRIMQVTGDVAEDQANQENELSRTRFIIGLMSLREITLVCGNEVYSIMLREPCAIRIRSAEHAKGMKLLLDNFWDDAAE